MSFDSSPTIKAYKSFSNTVTFNTFITEISAITEFKAEIAAGGELKLYHLVDDHEIEIKNDKVCSLTSHFVHFVNVLN